MSKSQAALEFLTTYAWAFIAISVTLGALYYSGVFDFGKYLPQKCTFPSQFECLDFSLGTAAAKIRLVNNLGEDICVTSLEMVSDVDSSVLCTADTTGWDEGLLCNTNEDDWKQATNKDFDFACGSGSYIADTRIELRVTMKYYSPNTESKPEHTINGRINGKIASS